MSQNWLSALKKTISNNCLLNNPLVILILLCNPIISAAQGSVDQEAIRPVIESQKGSILNVSKVLWHTYTFSGKDKKTAAVSGELNNYLAATEGYYTLDEKIQIVELANRVRLPQVNPGRQLVIPSFFPQDYRSYSPYPFFYQPAASMPKLFIIDKYTQTFGAYEFGALVHWGIVSSGRRNTSTPAGRYNFNWKTYFKLSNAAPEGVEWRLYWVYNFYAKIGLHVHQYSLPIGAHVSHGCVRTARPDAEWNYTWANGWVRDAHGRLLRNGTPVVVINDNPPGSVAHWKIADNTVVSLVELPENLMKIRSGAAEQRTVPWESGW